MAELPPMLRRIDPSSPISPAASTSGSRPAGVASYSHSPTGAQRPAPPSPAGAARSAARIFTLRIRDVVWRDDPKEPEARWAFIMRECKIACPPTLPEFYQRVERRFGLRPGVFACTIEGEALHTDNYLQQRTGTAVLVELKQPNDWSGDVSTEAGLHSLRKELSVGAEWVKIAEKTVETPCFSFHIRGCRQLALDDSSFSVASQLTTICHPVKARRKLDDQPLFPATLDPTNVNCFSREIEYNRERPFEGVRLTGNIDIDVGNADCRFDRPFWHMLDEKSVQPIMTWIGPPVAPASEGVDIEIERWAAKVSASSGLSKAACEFLEKAYAGELVFLCDTTFSQPETRAFRLAIRVRAASGPTSTIRFILQGFMLRVNFFFQSSLYHHHRMLDTDKKLGLVWDLDQTLIHADPPNELLEQVKHDAYRKKSIRGYHKPVVLRAGVRKVLENLSSKFEMHCFCNGWMSHAICVLEAFDLTKYFSKDAGSKPRVISGHWTTRNQLAFGPSGCKDFRTIFDFYRYRQFQETVLAVDDLVKTWDNPPKLWKRAKEQPCVLQITGFGSGPTGTSVTNTTISRFEKLLCAIHDEFFANESLRKLTKAGAGITQNAKLYVPRNVGYMIKLRDGVERKLIGPIAGGSGSARKQLHKHEQMASELLGKYSASGLEQKLGDVDTYDIISLRGMLRHLGLDDPNRPDDIRSVYIDRLVFYDQSPREGCICVDFDGTPADVEVYEGMPLHDFICAALAAQHEGVKAKLEPLVRRQARITKRNFNMLVSDPHMFELREAPNAFDPITTELWNTVFAAAASSGTFPLHLHLSKQALVKYQIDDYHSQVRRVGKANAVPHPSGIVEQRHKFEGKVFYALLELIANSLDATRHNQSIRVITIELHEENSPGPGPPSYCVSITDNGRGMDEQALIPCVTYGLGRKLRGKDLNRLDDDEVLFLDSIFNRFGVGMLDASFSMGENLYVMTKQAHDDEVRQVSLEYLEMCRKWDQGTGAYEFPIVSRQAAQAVYEDESQIPQALCKYESIKDMVAREPVDGSFTTVIVQGVRTELVQQFFELDQSRKDVYKLADDLGHTYQYFMTADSPDMNAGIAKCLTIHPEQPLRLQLRLPGLSDPIDTKSIPSEFGLDGNLEHRFQEAGKNERWFFVRYYKGLAGALEALRGTSGTEKVEAQRKVDEMLNAKPYIALGVLRYFPSKTFAETHPMAGAPLDAKEQRQEQTLPDRQVECRWQGQTLVKQTEKMSSLPFADRRVKKSEVTDIPEVCFKRWRCTLFCSGHWDVGSNKMELALPDFSNELKYATFSQFMTSKELAVFGTYVNWNKSETLGGSGGWQSQGQSWKRSGQDAQPMQDFRKWLRECHQNFDEDLKYEEPFAPDLDLRSQLEQEDQVEGCCWRKVILAGNQKLSNGDMFSFKHRQHKKNVYAEVVLFCRDPTADESAGTVYFQQQPKEFYPQLLSESLASLTMSKDGLTLLEYDPKRKQKCKNAVAKELATKCPHKFVISTSRSGQPRTEVVDGEGVETESNAEQFFFVDIVNRNGRSLTDLSGAQIGDVKMQTRLVADGPFDTRDEAQNADFNSKNPKNLDPKGSDPPTKPMALNDSRGAFKRYQKAGFYAIDFECVLDTPEVKAKIAAGQPLPPMGFEFNNHRREILEVKGSKVHQFWFAEGFEFEEGGMFNGGIRIGSATKQDIELVLQDKHKNEVLATADHLRGLKMTATARLVGGNLTLEQRLDKSSGLKLTKNGTLLLTLGWKWPTNAAWNQPISKPGSSAKFAVTLTSEIRRPTGVESLKTFKFGQDCRLELWPRAPTELWVNMDEVTIGDEEPLISVVFRDENGNESGSIAQEIRNVEVLMKLGAKNFRLCKPTAPENVQEAVAIGWNRYYTNKGFLAAFRGKSSCEAQVTATCTSLDLQTTVSVTIRQPQMPVAAVVLCGAEPEKTTVSADRASLENLRIKLENSLGNNVEWADQSPIQVTWNGDDIPGVTANYAGHLPPLNLSNVSSVSGSPYTFEGLAKFRSTDGTETEIDLHFEVNLVAGSAVSWIVELHEQEIQVNEPGQLESAISVLPVDANGNQGADPDGAQPMIELEAESSDSLELTGGGCKETSRAAVKKFLPKRNSCLHGKINSRDPYAYLRVCDASSSLTPHAFRLKLQPGEPTELRLVHSILTQHDDQYNANVPAVWTLQNLEAMLVDMGGNRVPQKDVVLNLTGRNVSCDKLKERTDESGKATFRARSDLRPQKVLDNGAGSYTLEVSAGSRIRKAKINCVVELTNEIVDLAVSVNTDVTATAGQVLPPGLLTVDLETQDAEKFVPCASMFRVTICQKVRRAWKPVASASMAVSEENGIGETTIWHKESGQEYIPILAGQYKIECVCTDSRAGLASTHRVSETLQITGGAAHYFEEQTPLECVDGTVTNGSDRARRIIVPKLLLQVKDQHGNNTTLNAHAPTTGQTEGTKPQEPEPQQEDSLVVATLHDEASGIEIPDALEGGHATALGKGRFEFGEIALREGAGGDSKRSLYIRFAALGSEIRPIECPPFEYVPFTLLSEVGPVDTERIANLKSQLRDIDKQLESLDQVLDEWRENLTDVEGSIQAKQAALTSELDAIEGLEYQAADLSDQGKMEEFVAAFDEICSAVRQNKPKKRRASRPKKKLPGDEMSQYGEAVVAIGYVADETEARVLSWAAGSRITAILAHDSIAQKRLDELKRASYAEDQLVPFQVKDNGSHRLRTESEMRGCTLPLQLPLQEGETVILRRGEEVCIGRDIPLPRFAVNMFDLPVDKERHRDTLLWNMYKHTLVMPSRDDAVRYRQACAKKRRICPAIYTLDGRRIQSDGLNDPNATMPEREDWPWCFGALSHDEYPEFYRAIVAKQLASDLGDLLSERTGLQDTIDAMKDDDYAVAAVSQTDTTSSRRDLKERRQQLISEIESCKRKAGIGADGTAPKKRRR